ncbi:MAG: hypothetical protein HKO57_17140, partial [Akkermansiaceae bacterium]|nr:hypothetical protein [Akkermansiaceae bacterium]
RWEIVVDIDVNNFMDDPLFDFEAESDVPDGGGGFMTLAFPTMPSHMAQGLLRDNTGNVFTLVSVERR